METIKNWDKRWSNSVCKGILSRFCKNSEYSNNFNHLSFFSFSSRRLNLIFCQQYTRNDRNLRIFVFRIRLRFWFYLETKIPSIRLMWFWINFLQRWKSSESPWCSFQNYTHTGHSLPKGMLPRNDFSTASCVRCYYQRRQKVTQYKNHCPN